VAATFGAMIGPMVAGRISDVTGTSAPCTLPALRRNVEVAWRNATPSAAAEGRDNAPGPDETVIGVLLGALRKLARFFRANDLSRDFRERTEPFTVEVKAIVHRGHTMSDSVPFPNQSRSRLQPSSGWLS
jgi:hypothetical protein